MINVFRNYANFKGNKWRESFKLISKGTLFLKKIILSSLITGNNNEWEKN